MEATRAEAPGAATSPRARVRARFAVVLLLLGLAVAFVPGLAAGDAFLPKAWTWSSSLQIPLPLVAAQPPGATPTLYVVNGDKVAVDQTRGVIAIRGTGRVNIIGLPFPGTSLPDLVLREAGWSAAVVALLALAPLFAWWRRAGLTFGRVAGVASSAAAAASVCLLVLVPRSILTESAGGVWWTVPLGAVLMGAAFAVAPAPVPRSDD